MEDGDSVISEAAEKHPEGESEENQFCYIIQNIFLPPTPSKKQSFVSIKERKKKAVISYYTCGHKNFRKEIPLRQNY